MNTNRLPRIASALLIGAVAAIAPVAIGVALAPSAAAIEIFDEDAEVNFDRDGLAAIGIAPAIEITDPNAEVNFDADALADQGIAPATGEVEYRDEYGNLVDPIIPAEGDVDRSQWARDIPAEYDLDGDGYMDIVPIAEEIIPISITESSLSTGATIAIIAAFLVGGTGIALSIRLGRIVKAKS
jgi:hypothetical protein